VTRSHPRPGVRFLSPLRDFMRTETSGGVLLVAGAVLALLWVNSPWSASYERLWSQSLSIGLGDHVLRLSLRQWLNEGLMTIFFLVVGLEIKRELVVGHLKTKRAAVLPIFAALGGMIVPAGIYLAIAGGSAPRGWAIPMATDIALAVGVLAVVGDRVPSSLRAFLLALAIVDDIGAIVIIALVYSSGIGWSWLLTAVALLVCTRVARQFDVQATWLYFALGVVVWFALHEAGVHPTLAGVAMGLLAPATARLSPELVDAEELADVSSLEAVFATTEIARSSVSVVEWLQYALHPWTSYVIVPLFAFANAGIVVSASGISDALKSPVFWGVFFGLVAGKPIGVLLAPSAVQRFGLADGLESSAGQRLGIGAAAGIGFTVALFITELALTEAQLRSHAKLAILLASAVAAGLSLVLLKTTRPVASEGIGGRSRSESS
jgi:Na+:H+ antiporter, NhaA family